MCTGAEAAIASAIIAGTAYQVHSGEEARKAAYRREHSQAKLLEEQTAARNKNIRGVREQYGIGNTPEAQANARTLSDSIKQYYQNALKQNLGQADTQYAAASRTSRQNLARVGQLGSGLDANARSGTLSDYLRARQNAITQAAAARDQLSNSLAQQRMGFEQGISGGTVANPDYASIANQRNATLSSAQANVVPAAVGNLFTTAGQTYFQGRQQDELGNQGLRAFGFSDQSNRGRIT